MQSNRYFTSFYPVDSFVHRLNPTIKLICFILMLVSLLASSDIKLHVFILFITSFLLYSSKVPLRFYFDTLYGLRYIFIIFILLLATKGLYLNDAALILIKIVTIMLYLSMMFYTTSPSELKYGIEKLLTPFNLFNVNISGVINKLVGILTFFPILFSVNRSVLINASARGLDYSFSDILSRIFVVILSFKNTLRLTIERIKNIKLVSTLKGYSTKKYRTNLRTNKAGFRDVLLLLLHLLFLLYYCFEKGLI